MAFLQRIASGLRESLFGASPGQGKAPPSPPRLLKSSSSGRKRTSSRGAYAAGLLEEHTRQAIAAFVEQKFEQGEAKPHVFTQFWLQFPKLQAGFEVLRGQLESRTGSRDGPLPLAVLNSAPQEFGLDESSPFLQELCKGASSKLYEIDFVGLVMLLLVVHLTEPPACSPGLSEEVRTMLRCLELAFTHFNSARKGKLDKREVADAMQHESAKAHTKEGRGGRTGNRLANKLFEGLDWENDNTISFEDFLRGIVQLVQDEYGDEEDDEEEDESGREGSTGRRTRTRPSSSRPSTDALNRLLGRRSAPTGVPNCGPVAATATGASFGTAGGKGKSMSRGSTPMLGSPGARGSPHQAGCQADDAVEGPEPAEGRRVAGGMASDKVLGAGAAGVGTGRGQGATEGSVPASPAQQLVEGAAASTNQVLMQ